MSKVLLKKSGHIALLTLNRPEARNALSLEMMRQLMAHLEAMAHDDLVRVIILFGHGPAFWRLLASYPRLERARGFLDGFAHAEGLPPGPDDDPVDGSADEGGPAEEGSANAGSVADEGLQGP